MLHHFRGYGRLLDHSAVRGEVAAQNSNAAFLGIRVAQGADNAFIQNARFKLGQVFSQGFARGREHRGIQKAALGKFRQNGLDAPGPVQIFNVRRPGRGEFA